MYEHVRLHILCAIVLDDVIKFQMNLIFQENRSTKTFSNQRESAFITVSFYCQFTLT